jgi:hypothetical protein
MRTDVRICVASNLHLELTRGWDLPSGGARPRFDVIVVAGNPTIDPTLTIDI